MKVYVVTSGRYSDYHIEAVFGSLEKAEAFVGSKNDEARIEEYELNNSRGEHFKQGYACTIRLQTGDVLQEWEMRPNRMATGFRGRIAYEPDWNSSQLTKDSPLVIATATSYESSEHAHKLAIEGRQAWLRAGKPTTMEGQEFSEESIRD